MESLSRELLFVHQNMHNSHLNPTLSLVILPLTYCISETSTKQVFFLKQKERNILLYYYQFTIKETANVSCKRTSIDN